MSNPNVDSTLAAAQLDAPKSSAPGIFELPCGYLAADGVLHTDVSVREISGHEEDLLASKQIPESKKLGELVGRCITRIGSLTDPEQLRQASKELLIGDRVFLLFAVRRVTLGDDYPFRSKCPECGKEGLYHVNLAELDIKKMPQPTKRAGYDFTLPSGKKIRIKTLNGEEEEAYGRKKIADSDIASSALMPRVEQLDGKPPTLGDIKALGMRDRNFIRQDIVEQIDGGVDTTVDVTCASCEVEYKKDLEVGQSGFFFPSQTLKNWKLKSST